MFYPKAFTYLGKIAKELDYELVMITNQDGLGTDSFPEDTFWPVHDFVLRCFENEGIVFENVLIDRTFAHENADTRKPGTGLLKNYFSDDYDLKNSFVIGDRLTDIELAKNLGGKGIFINDHTNLGVEEISVKKEELNPFIALETNDWQEIYEFLKLKDRVAEIHRKTNETDIKIRLNFGRGREKAKLKRDWHFRPYAGSIGTPWAKWIWKSKLKVICKSMSIIPSKIRPLPWEKFLPRRLAIRWASNAMAFACLWMIVWPR